MKSNKIPLGIGTILACFLAMPSWGWETSATQPSWGGATDSTTHSTAESTVIHAQNGELAGQVNSAELGILFGSANISISMSSVGSQNVVSTTVTGDGNDVSINVGDQTTNNTGDVFNNGSISVTEAVQ